MMRLLFCVLVCLMALGCSSMSTESSRYEFVYEQVSWTEAKRRAEDRGGHLACFETLNELKLVKAKMHRSRALWVGLTDVQREGDWFWLNGEPLEPYMIDLLERGEQLEQRDYGHLLFNSGLNSRDEKGEKPKGWKAQEHVEGFIIEWER
ncbi:lectin-like protein [Echinimonas agarilytica]|uniref:C-type lectin domain-containing protein n=1 Tax=Echinimonas agarilytica TaxID=1215918 RepID=A0AA41W3Z0_9GAMM|nr:lectin-like protein [Echinimonas agarilytica]MCM2678148.1 hypothetical protein [Echinimonas agarilytica]